MRKVVENKCDEIALEETSFSRIYAFAHVYTDDKKNVEIFKLNYFSVYDCSFASMQDSRSFTYPGENHYEAIQKAMKHEDVYEFKTQKEFLEWALKELNK